jgi:uncharacterized membrane protein YtjA (UPF0391 family)
MFQWTLIAAVIALVASLLGLSGIAGFSANLAVVLLIFSVCLGMVSLVFKDHKPRHP